MIDGKLLVEKLLKYARAFLHLEQRDEIYMRNLGRFYIPTPEDW